MPRLFEETESNNPLESFKVAFGKAATSTYNMTFANLFAYLRSKLVPSETVTGLIEIATEAEALAGTDDARAITPLKLTQKLATLATGLVTHREQIGVWDMDADAQASGTFSAFSLDPDQVVGIQAVILADIYTGDGFEGTNDQGEGGTVNFTTGVDSWVLNRATGGRYDNTNYNDGTINRGYLLITLDLSL